MPIRRGRCGRCTCATRVADPEDVYKSACHMADTTYPFMYLARPTDAMVHEFILSQFVTLWEEYRNARKRARTPRTPLHCADDTMHV